ncbi:SMI1/KNR4 family protein [Saccharibacillus sp. JS10]|uniref:SMI1/KNR4 family protein n=1 Tax=Saccharibacillus sp. JS10 TaxID=2950552 RepID=UPI00210E55AF|nr:SMI1/KNR4 family protein [Saccharibacillus sp. JS10]
MYEELSKRLDGFAGSKRLTETENPIQTEWITEAEAELGYRLPDSYRWWLQHFGMLRIGGTEIFTLAPPEFKEMAHDDLIIQHRLDTEQDWVPEHRLYIFKPDADEEFYFDVSQPIRESDVPVEYPIMLFTPFGADEEIYADSFASFLERLLQERGH